MQNLSQISGPVCPQLFDLASFLWTIAFDKAEPTLDQGYFIKSLGSGKIVRYIHHGEIVIEICEFNLKKGKIMKIVQVISNALCIKYNNCLCSPLILQR